MSFDELTHSTWCGIDVLSPDGWGQGTPSTQVPKDAKMRGQRACPLLSQEAVLVHFLFEDEVGIRSLDEITDAALLDEIGPVRSFVKKALTELPYEELDVVFWKDEDGSLKMDLRGSGDAVDLAKSLIGDRAAVPPTQH